MCNVWSLVYYSHLLASVGGYMCISLGVGLGVGGQGVGTPDLTNSQGGFSPVDP